MKQVTTECLIKSLIVIGFDRVDPLLFSLTLGSIAMDKNKLYMIVDKPFTSRFFNIFELKNGSYKLKDGISFDTDISPVDGYQYKVIDYLVKESKKTNFIEFLSNVNFTDIVNRKLEMLDNDDSKLCDKELELIKVKKR